MLAKFVPKFLLKLNFGRLIASIGLAIIVWGYVLTTQFPERTLPPFDLVLPDPIPMRGLDLAPLSEQAEQIRVTISGQSESVSTITYNQIKPYLDLNSYTQAGTYSAEVKLRLGLLSPDLNIKIEPKRIQVRLENHVSKEIRVEVIAEGEVNPDYVLEDQIQVSPSQITVEGRQSLVDQVAKARVSVNVKGRVGALQAASQVQLVDTKGQLLTETTLSLNPNIVNVTANINYKLATRTVPIRVITKGEIANGYIAGTAKTEPTLATLASGDVDLLNGIAFVETEPFDINGASAETSGIVRLKPPINVTIQGSNMVQVKVGIVPFQTSKTLAVPVEIVNGASNLRYRFDQRLVNLTISGPYQAFLDLSLDRLKAVVDVEGRGVGLFALPVEVDLPAELVLTNQPSVNVVISLPPSPTAVPTRPPTATPTFTARPTATPTFTPLPPTVTISPTIIIPTLSIATPTLTTATLSTATPTLTMALTPTITNTVTSTLVITATPATLLPIPTASPIISITKAGLH